MAFSKKKNPQQSSQEGAVPSTGPQGSGSLFVNNAPTPSFKVDFGFDRFGVASNPSPSTPPETAPTPLEYDFPSDFNEPPLTPLEVEETSVLNQPEPWAASASLEEHDTSFDYAPSYLDEEMNESAHPIDIPVSPMPLDEEEEWVAPHESITSSVSDELDDFLFSSAYASEPQEMETTETYSTPAAWSPEPIEEPSTNFEEAYPEVKEPDVIYPAYQPPTQGFATGSIQQPYISQPPPMPFEPMGPTMDDFWAHYAPGFDEVVIPPKPPGYPSSEPDHFLDSVHQKLYPDEYDPFAELSATSDEAYPEDLFAIGSKPTLSYFDDPEDLSSVKQFSFESDEDDEQIPDMMPHIHSQESASVAEVSPPSPEPQTNDIQVLGISPLEKDHQLVLVKMNQTIALMGQTGTQSEVVKIFEVSPLTAANNTFTAVKAFEMEGKTMYQVKAGQWNAVMSIDHGVFTIHTELVG